VERADLAERVAAVEQRLGLLERGYRADARGGVPGGEADRFWALNGLRARLAGGEGAVVFAGSVPLSSGEEYTWQYGRTTEALLDDDWSHRSAVVGALGHPIRLRLLQQVLTGTRSAAELQADDRLGTTGQLYHHLRQLVAAGWLHQTTRGHYAVPAERVVPLLVLLVATER
jgi:hypothetical protein